MTKKNVESTLFNLLLYDDVRPPTAYAAVWFTAFDGKRIEMGVWRWDILCDVHRRGIYFMSTELEVSPEVSAQIQDCEERIGYTFQDKQHLLCALTHASGAQHRLTSNERLEFLGDAILGAVVCEMLYHQFPDSLEGNLTKIKSIVVSRHTCAKISDHLGLEACLIVGKGMATSKRVPRSLLSDMFESIVAAIYLDGGMEIVKGHIMRWTQPEIELAASGVSDDNFKSQLQQIVQKEYGTTPSYMLLAEKGPDHKKCFRIAAKFDGRQFPAAWGENKKKAEQRAAGNALATLNSEAPPFDDDEPNV